MIDLPEIGEMFCGKYELKDILGEGGFSKVYRATDAQMSRDVAIKIIEPAEDGYRESVVGRFMREGRVLAGLVDPHNITMYDFGETDDGLLYMVFEFIDGRDLADVLRDQGALKPSVVAHVVDQVLRGLAEAHEAGILHRDVKPANIMLFEYGGDPYRAKLLDFGIARPAERERATPVTDDGIVVGTPRYMSPEQMIGGELTPRSDLYSLGLVAFEMLTGRKAHDGESPREIARQQFGEEPIMLPEGCAPEAFKGLLEQMMNRDVEQRPASAGEVLRRMRETKREFVEWRRLEIARTARHGAVGDSASGARPTSRRRYGLRALLLIVSALCVGAVLAIFLLTSLDEEEEPAPAAVDSERVTKIARSSPAVESPDAGRSAIAISADGGDDAGSDLSALSGGCGQPERELGLVSFTATTPQGERSWTVYLPRGYEPATPHPVLLLFHRSVMDGPGMIQNTSFDRIADEHDVVLIAPTSVGQQFPWAEKQTELDFVWQIVSRSAEKVCLDLSRIYAAGLGRGASFAEDLDCVMPLSGVAVTLSGQSESERRCEYEDHAAAPRIRIYGREDKYVPVEGGTGCMMFGSRMVSANDLEDEWKNTLGCRGKTQKWIDEPGGECRTWDCSIPFVHCETSGGHDWPSAPADPIEVPGCQELIDVEPIDYGDAIWRFFAKHSRPITPTRAFDWGSYER